MEAEKSQGWHMIVYVVSNEMWHMRMNDGTGVAQSV
jgi:hypothetical protein